MMLTQRVPQLHCDYLQTAHLSAASDSKASPLALLAATCSSIGRNDLDKPSEPVMAAVSPMLTKNSPKADDQLKSSFKPYKTDSKPILMRSSPSVVAPTKTSPNCTRMNPPPMFMGQIPPPLPPIDSEKLRSCRSTFLDSRDSAILPPVMKCHPTSLPPLPTVKHSPHGCNDYECTSCTSSLTRGQVAAPRQRSPPASCPCGLCLQNRPSVDQTCHYQPPALYSPFKGLPPPSVCRVPNCIDCNKAPHGTMQNFLHPALVHQCTQGGYPPAPHHIPPPPHSSMDYSKGSTPGKGFVCNWMAEGKHCGKTFATSEDLFQHLKSHTSAQQQIQNCEPHVPVAMPPTPSQSPSPGCSIHGCPCRNVSVKNRAALSNLSYGPSTRYTPYSRAMSTVPGGTSGFQGHSYAPHGVYHY